MNGIVELRFIAKKSNALENIVRLSKEEYCFRNTGEVFQYNHGETRADNKAALAKTFRGLRHLINENFTGAPNELMFTFTYAENMTDPKRLYRDLEVFKKRLKRRYPDVELLIIVEPQGRGAWHSHILSRFDQRKIIFIPNDEICKLWGHGFTTTKSLKGVDNLGAYLTAYLADIPLDGTEVSWEEAKAITRNGVEIAEKEVFGDDGQKLKKKIIKGGRLHLYPPGMNIYRKTRGIRSPEEKAMEYAQAKEIVGSRTPDYSTAREIYDDNGKFLNAVFYEQYNLRREKKQAQIEEASQDDPAISDRGIPNRPASEREQPKDPEILQANPECIFGVCRPGEPRQDNPPLVQTVLHPPDGNRDSLYDNANLYPWPPGFPDMVLQ